MCRIQVSHTEDILEFKDKKKVALESGSSCKGGKVFPIDIMASGEKRATLKWRWKRAGIES